MPTYDDLNLTTKSREELAAELRQLTSQAEALIGSSGDELNRQAEELQKKLKGVLDLLSISAEGIGEQVKAGAKAADTAIRRNPYAAIGIAAGAGLLIGLLMKRK